MARRPGRFALTATLACLLAASGVARWSSDAGTGLLAGQRSDARETYDRFADQYGADPIVIVLSAHSPTAFTSELNLLKLAELENDLSHDDRVAAVLGPGTLAASEQRTADAEVQKLRVEYPYFVTET